MTETNKYARHSITVSPPSRRALLRNWQDVSRPEMMAFVALILNMGIIQLANIKDYWGTHETINLSFFRYSANPFM